ncbi:ABC transporter substrate-binding protein [Streptomyces sp. XM4193]|uniref:ABC transporter substrate-binding protein n=1 Tax=Streptomyces sp. XM4193 TaxID=2929782 RepID=UPI001FFA1871|nr:ABC transporter substrate-binding protein [Streptomyces sp. XM4193]MCK1798965.1 ABC transporter substrate-binding protein [Streptomyces sp. XM4193]
MSVAALLAGCGTLSDSDGEDGGPVRVGTTSQPSSLDPADAWDGSWELYRNTFQSLMHIPKSSGAPEADAAEKCEFTDRKSQVYRCTLQEGLKFSSGNALDAEAVKHSFDRIRQIDSAKGPAPLLESIDEVETSGDRTVIFHLKRSDATFPLILTTPAGSLVDPEHYPLERLRRGTELTGSGPYRLAEYEPGTLARLERNDSYRGSAELKNDTVEIHYFKKSDGLVKALRDDEIDLVYRGLTPEQITGLKDGTAGSGIRLDEVVGTEIRYLAFNPQDEAVSDPAVREAMAQLLDRGALVRKVYRRTTEPLYSMVPSGITGHTSAFFDRFGAPSRAKAEKLLTEAGIDEPVEFTLWYTTDRYGATMKAEFEEIQRQLNDSELFRVKVRGQEWESFQKAHRRGEYPVFGRGWFPDFPDADNYIGPFVGENNVLGIPYEDAELTGSILPSSRQETDRGTAARDLREAQKILAKDVRLLPLWQGRVYLAAKEDIAGVEWAIDTSTLMRAWELHRKGSW